jgi:HlyD family secretion protein
MMRPTADQWRPRRFLLVGYIATILLVGGIGAWAAVTRIAGAVIAPGAVQVEGNRQVVQHPTGGVIEEIRARDGDTVLAGEVLVRLDGRDLRTELGIVEAPGRRRLTSTSPMPW